MTDDVKRGETKKAVAKRKKAKTSDSDSDDDSKAKKPLKPRKKKEDKEGDDEDKKKGGGASSEQSDVYRDVLEGMRRNESVVIDTRLNFTCGLPKKARIPRTKEQWRSMQNVQGKLTNNYAQIDISTIRIEGPLTLVDIQPIRADNNNMRFLKADEIESRLKALPRAALLGSPISIAHHPVFGSSKNFRAEVFGSDDPSKPTSIATEDAAAVDAGNDEKKAALKKPSLQQEWIFWLKDGNNRHYPMTVAAFAHLYRTGKMQPIELASPSGWMMFSDEDRIFVIPRDFATAKDLSVTIQDSPSTLSSAAPIQSDITPAVKLSKSAATVLSTAATDPVAEPIAIPALESVAQPDPNSNHNPTPVVEPSSASV